MKFTDRLMIIDDENLYQQLPATSPQMINVGASHTKFLLACQRQNQKTTLYTSGRDSSLVVVTSINGKFCVQKYLTTPNQQFTKSRTVNRFKKLSFRSMA